MPTQATHTKTGDARRADVVARAVLEAGARMGLTDGQLAQVIGVSGTTVSRMRKGEYAPAPESKTFELAVHLLRLFRGVDAILGGDDVAVRSWMTTENTALHARPVDMISSIQGLMEVATYVDSRRAPI